MERYKVDCLVIGAGVVGLAIARAMAQAGHQVWCVEREKQFGSQTSSRNSEVIHAGIYYPQNSLKARLCVKGKELLYQYCATHHIAHRRCGKLIVAANDGQQEALQQILSKAHANGVDDLVMVNSLELSKRAPSLSARAGIWSPSTGIIDCHGLMLQLLADAEHAGAQLVLDSELKNGIAESDGLSFELSGQNARIKAKTVINAAGLQAIDLAFGIDGINKKALPTPYYAKGSYFSYSGKVPFDKLIYPVPEVGGLGIHLTLDMQGRAKFGPDVEWLPEGERQFDYQVAEAKREKFYQAIRSYWPEVDRESLVPDYSGIRPKLSGPGEGAADFDIQSEPQHGIPGLINLFGIESPGLTASLAIADYVADLIAT